MNAPALCLPLLLVGLWQPTTENPCRMARLELRGPLREVVLASGAAAGSLPRPPGVTRIVGHLRRGEVRSVRVPVDARSGSGAPEPIRVLPAPSRGEDAERVRFLGYVDSPDPDPWRGMPPGLRGRSLPPLERPTGTLRPLELAWLLACAAAVLGARRRPAMALTLGLLGGAGALGLRRLLPVPTVAGVTVIEADLSASSAFRMDAAYGRLRLRPGDDPRRASTLPGAAPLDWTLELLDGGGSSLSCEAPGTVFLMSEPPGFPWRDLTAGGNSWQAFEQAWSRAPSGEWAAHGAWAAGEPLPAPLPGTDMPPGWLANGLPPGRGVLIARLAAGAVERVPGGGEVPIGRGGAVWLRGAGF